MESLKTDAIFSGCRKYRYVLKRIWDQNTPYALFCMLNPSTADEINNDPTIERCQRRSKMLGYGGLVVVNAFAYRSTDPEELYLTKDPVGPSNDSFILEYATNAGIIICGWGNHGSYKNRGKLVIDSLKNAGYEPYLLKANKDGSPAHPLYISYKVRPKKI